MNNTDRIDISLIHRIGEAGGKLKRNRAGWYVGNTEEIVGNYDVRFLCSIGVLLGKRKDKVLTLNSARLPRKDLASLKLIGNSIVYRDTRYNWKRFYPSNVSSRYVRGTVICLKKSYMETALVIHPGALEIVTISRPHSKTHWKYSNTEAIGVYAPGKPKHSADIWNRIMAAGLVPEGWDAQPIGEPYTFERLRDVKRLMDLIGSPAISIEEQIAYSIFCQFPERFEYIRMLAFNARRNISYDAKNLELANAYDLLLEKEAEAIEVAEAKAVVQYIWRFRDAAQYHIKDPIQRIKARAAVEIPSLEEIKDGLKRDYYHYSVQAIEIGHMEVVRLDQEIKTKIMNRNKR